MSNLPNPPGDNSQSEKNVDLPIENNDSQKTQDINSQPLKLWIDTNWYIPVDEEGRCIGTCFEGALGFVIRLEHRKKGIFALKIPRLMGETYRENAYINDLMEKEFQAVEEVFICSPGENTNPKGLLKADISLGSILKGSINTSGNEDAQQWHDSKVFVHFEKGLTPQFCLVKSKQNDELEKFPPNSKCPIDSPEAYRLLCEYNHNLKTPWSETIFIVAKKSENSHPDNPDNKVQIFSIKDLQSQDKNIWYTALPAIMYAWAPGTLQEVISRKQRGKWNFEQHLELMEILCMGLEVLHGKGMLHADLRPANVVYLGDEKEPRNYFISDYGSFSQANPQSTENNQISGETLIGPTIGGERTSPFYSPERSLGREREEANTAVVYFDDNTIYLIVGWRSELIDPNNQEPKRKIIQEWIKENESQQTNNSTCLLDEGDRIQIREYIFELSRKERNIGNKQIFECKPQVWEIYQNRIVVAADLIDGWEWFPISRRVDLLRWSAATDLYSLGAVALYSVYFDTGNTSREVSEEKKIYNEDDISQEVSEEKKIHNEDDISQKVSENSSHADEEFREMLNYLASKPYFDSVWPKIEALRINLENYLQEDYYSYDIYEKKIYIDYETEDSSSKNEKIKLKEQVLKVSSLITESVPGANKLVINLDFNLGNFIFFIHFIFCCLHRQSDLNGAKDWMKELPFCKDRREMPDKSNAASKAKNRLNILRKDIISKNALKALVVKEQEISSGFVVQPSSTLSLQVFKITKERDNIVETCKKNIAETNKENQKYINQISRLESQINHRIKEIKEKDNIIETDKKNIAKINKENQKYINQISRLESQINHRIKEIKEKDNIIETNKKNIAEKNQENQKYIKQISRLESQIEKVKNEKSEQDDEIKSLTKLLTYEEKNNQEIREDACKSIERLHWWDFIIFKRNKTISKIRNKLGVKININNTKYQ